MTSGIKVALIGYGRMGKELHTIIRERGWPDPILIDPHHNDAYGRVDEAPLDQADVCIEFTEPDQALDAILRALRTGTPVISGTTGWEQNVSQIRKAVRDHRTAFLHANNFSLGVYLFSEIVEYATKLLGRFPEYDLALHETHHRGKKDVPSGTAQMLARKVRAAHPGKRRTLYTVEGADIEPETLMISSSRVGSVFGEHCLRVDSEGDGLEIKHVAKSRRGFAEGAVTAAKWIVGEVGIFTLEDMINDITSA